MARIFAGRLHASDLVYTGLALASAVLTIVGGSLPPLLIVCIAAALVPWLLIAIGIPLPYWLFAVLGIVPVVPVAISTGIGASLFLSLTAASRVASRSDQLWLIVTLTAVVLALPFAALILQDEWDAGAVYFALGGAFSMILGASLRRSTRLAEELRRADAELLEAAASGERHRIARDVHDLVAHSLTVVVLHIGGARRVLRTDPDSAEAALIGAERVSRESLDAIRGVVGVLRDDGEQNTQSLDIERLVAIYRSAGLPVSLQIDGDATSLPSAIRVTLYRVVQEALANAARHSPNAPASVELIIDDRSALARVTNTLAGPRPRDTGRARSFGLVGLREQAELLGGTLESGPRGEQWLVECKLPIEVTA